MKIAVFVLEDKDGGTVYNESWIVPAEKADAWIAEKRSQEEEGFPGDWQRIDVDLDETGEVNIAPGAGKTLCITVGSTQYGWA